VTWAVLLLATAPASAQDWEKLIMPGEVIEGHAEIEGNCSSCHRPFRRLEQRSLCLDCHDHANVADDIRERLGFHGRSEAAGDVECSTCHSEHQGRLADVVGLDPDTFNHDLTDFALEGLHQSADCAGCHDSAKKHREASADCVACHEEEDSHHGSLGQECADCHSPSGWGAAVFDHDKTDFPLEDKHVDVRCASCHPSEQYKDTPQDCVSCHRVNDVHTGRMGPKCASCHSPAGWKAGGFDHGRDTDFALQGAHGQLSCETCHSDNAYEVKLRTDCYSCHESDDEHKSRFGESCDQCHSVSGWNAETFDHAKTQFPLHGVHQQVSCVGCHTGVLGEVALDTACGACHLDDDVHHEQLGRKCGDCHREKGWTADVFFDHGLSRFPLLGLHGVASCEECHTTKQFHDTSMLCNDCHRQDDFHEAHLGTTCQHCHNPNGWTFWRFDHDTQTDFLLDGAHTELSCAACHTRPMGHEVAMSQECGSCHQVDDVHLGSYGANCARCHSTSEWDKVRRVR
jgi:hypothetical protein